MSKQAHYSSLWGLMKRQDQDVEMLQNWFVHENVGGWRSSPLRAASSSLPYGHLPISCIWLKISQEAPLQVLTLHILKQFYIRGILQSGCLDKYNFEIMCNVSQVILLYRLKSIWFSSDDGLVMETPSQNGENGEPPGDPIHDSRAHNFFVVKCHLKKRKIIPVKCICFSITCYWI